MEARTLVLTSWYMPIQIIPWTEAITGIYTGKFEQLAGYPGQSVRSPSVEMDLPAVIRVRKPFGAAKKGIKFSRTNVAARDGHRCQYCLRKLPLSKLTYDHVIPKCQGGLTTWTNIVMACKACNSKKDGRTPDQAGMTLHCVPRRPNSLPLEPLRLPEAAPDIWKQFVGA